MAAVLPRKPTTSEDAAMITIANIANLFFLNRLSGMLGQPLESL
jgi:hypothetical protein